MNELEINDMYEAAWLLVSGHHLDRFEPVGRGSVNFVISGDGASGSLDEFRSGRANGNIAVYLFTLEKLKDQLFKNTRKGDKRNEYSNSRKATN